MLEEPQLTDWAYAAGLVDGEGCIAITRSFSRASDRYSYGVAVVVVNRDREVLDWMQQLWSGWVVAMLKPHSGNGRERAAWAWRSPTGAASEPFLNGIRPWLRIKVKQCENALQMVAILERSRRTLGPKPLPLPWLELQEKHYWIQRELNHRGNRPFEAKAMHSPRQIGRQRRIAAHPETS